MHHVSAVPFNAPPPPAALPTPARRPVGDGDGDVAPTPAKPAARLVNVTA